MNKNHPLMGFLVTSGMGNKGKIPKDAWLAVDNGCFSNPAKYSDAGYEKLLMTMPIERTLFATAPDVLGSREETVDRSIPMLKRIRAYGLKSAFVAQDGWEEETTPWEELDVIFIGGSTEFKFRGGRAAVAAAKRRHKWAHMGRVNSLDRMKAAAGIGCDSVDGTHIKFNPTKHWNDITAWLDHLTEQHAMAV